MFGDVGQRLRLVAPFSRIVTFGYHARPNSPISSTSSFKGNTCAPRGYASLTRLVIGASIIAGLFGTTASVALAASPVTFAVLREEDPHNGVQTTDVVYRNTDTITGTGTAATGITVDLSSASPAQYGLPRHHGAERRSAARGHRVHQRGATPTATKPGVVLTVDGSACVPPPWASSRINELASSTARTDVNRLNLMWEGTCPTREFHLQVGHRGDEQPARGRDQPGQHARRSATSTSAPPRRRTRSPTRTSATPRST